MIGAKNALEVGPKPEKQLPIRTSDGKVSRPDLVYPTVKIYVEFDSTAWHGSKKSLARDHIRQRSALNL